MKILQGEAEQCVSVPTGSAAGSAAATLMAPLPPPPAVERDSTVPRELPALCLLRRRAAATAPLAELLLRPFWGRRHCWLLHCAVAGLVVSNEVHSAVLHAV